MSHFMGEDEGDFIFVVIQWFKEADIDAHVVSDGAEGIETGVVIDEVVVRLFQD